MSPSSFSLVARDLARFRGGTTVLDGVDLTVSRRTRLGVVGPNGVGKTTLLRLLAGLDQADRGTVTRTPPNARVGYLPQEPERSAHETLLEFLGRRSGVSAADAELERATAALARGAAGSDNEYARALDDYLAAGGPDFDPRARATCADLGLPEALLSAPTAILSGGQAARASLAAIVVSRFDVFLLDEPTNDLDFAGLARLERFLDGLDGGVVVVSHDRTFLDRTVTRVLELDEHARTGTELGGGWSGYLEARATARRHAEDEYAAYRAERSRLEARARTQRQWAVEGVRKARRSPDNDKMQRDFRINASERQASKVRATGHALTRLEAVEKPWESWDLRFTVATASRSGNVVLRLAGAVIERGSFRLGPVDLEIGWAERVAIVGPNGSGKTTLLGALLGDVPLSVGERWLGPGVVVGEMDQARSAFVSDRPLLDTFVTATRLTRGEARSLLAKFGLGADHVLRRAATLSPGERTRAVLASFAAQGVNCLVLDEPTNHLDLPAIEQLELALDGYDGTLLLVSHDRALLEAVRVTRTVDAQAWSSPPT
ncbi:MAG: ABC-F family ATP-binding cassette domain-containing protein [Acidimicrobiia bacterium]